MTLEEISQELYGHWIGAKVLKRDEAGQPIDFEVVARDVDYLDSRAYLKKCEEYCLFYAGPVPENNLTVMF